MARKGMRFSEEHKRKIGEARRGKRHSEETKQKIAESLSGRTLSEEHRRKVSEALKGRSFSEEHRRKISESQRGKRRGPHSEETRRKMSESREGPRNGMYGKRHSEESRQKMSEAMRGKRRGPYPEKHRRSIAESLKGRVFSEEHRRKISLAKRGKPGKPLSEEHKQKISEGLHRLHLEYWRKGAIAGALASRRANPSSIEVAVCTALDEMGIDYEAQKAIGPYIVDIFFPKINLIVECDGDYWHTLPGAQEKDRRRDTYFRSKGYTVVHLWEHEIREEPKSAILQALRYTRSAEQADGGKLHESAIC